METCSPRRRHDHARLFLENPYEFQSEVRRRCGVRRAFRDSGLRPGLCFGRPARDRKGPERQRGHQRHRERQGTSQGIRSLHDPERRWRIPAGVAASRALHGHRGGCRLREGRSQGSGGHGRANEGTADHADPERGGDRGQRQLRSGAGGNHPQFEHRHDRPAPHRQPAHQRAQLHQLRPDRLESGPRQRAQHRRRAHFRPELWRPARPFEPGQRGRRRCYRQFHQRRAFHGLAGSRAGIPDHHQRLRARIRARLGRSGQHHHPFGFVRDRNFQAVNPFSTVKNPAYTRVQAGTAFGGPIKKDKTFYYFSYEITRRHETGFSSIGQGNFGLTNFDASPFFAAPPGTFEILATSGPAGQAAFLSQFTAAPPPPLVPFLQNYSELVGAASGMAVNGKWPAAMGGFPGFFSSCQSPGTCFVPASFQTLTSQEGNFPVFEGTSLYSLRLDHNVTDRHRIMLRANVSPSTVTGIEVGGQDQPFGQNAYSRTSEQTYRDAAGTFQDTLAIGNNKVNEFRFQYARRGLSYFYNTQIPGGADPAINIPGSPILAANRTPTFSAPSSATSSATISPGPRARTTSSSARTSTTCPWMPSSR